MEQTAQVKHTNPRTIGLLIAAALAVALIVAALLYWRDSDTPMTSSASDPEPASVAHIEGTELSRITLSDRAAERLDIQTDTVREEEVSGASRLVIPYAAVYYDADGGAWVYTNPESLIFVRHAVVVDRIEGDRAILTEGPDAGMAIVTVGVAELYGTEYEVGH
jgi:hypothetical protein